MAAVVAFGATTLALGAAPAIAADPPSVQFGVTGGPETITVPAGVTALNLQVTGGSGGDGAGPGDNGGGGYGAVLTGSVAAEPGTVIEVTVGDQGGHYGTNPNNNHGGWGGSMSGGPGGIEQTNGPLPQNPQAGGGGGGATAVTVGGTIVMIAGGGGGGGTGGGIGGHGGAGGDAGDPSHDGYRGDCVSYGDGGHAGAAPSGEGLSGGIGDGNDGDAVAGGGGGGFAGGEGGHGGSDCAGGGGAGTSRLDPTVVGGSIATATSRTGGSVTIGWVSGATLEVVPSASSVAPGETVGFTGRLKDGGGGDLGPVLALAVSSEEPSDIVSGQSVTVTKPGTRSFAVSIPGSSIASFVEIEVRAAPAAVPGVEPDAPANALPATGLELWGPLLLAIVLALGGVALVGIRARRHGSGSSVG